MIDVRLICLLLALAAAACGPVRTPAATNAPFNSANPELELETPNSLPPGSTTINPFAPATGVYRTSP